MRKLAVYRSWGAGLLFLFLTSTLFLTGCGGSQAEPVFNITGGWNIFYTTTGTAGEQGPGLFNFSQTDNNLSGTTPQGQALSGSVSSLSVSFSWTGSDGAFYTYTGTISADGNTMSGTWSNSKGASGSWSAMINIASSVNVTGNWNVFHTTGTAGEQGPDLFTFSQSGNSVSGTAPQGQAVTGVVSGLNILFSWTGSDGVSNTYVGAVSGGNSMTGTWSATSGQSGTWRATKS